MPKRRAAGAISTGHGSFHLGDRTEVVTNANTRLTRYSRSRSAPPRDQAAPPRGRRPDRTCATALPAPQNCGAVKAGWARKASGLWDGLHTATAQRTTFLAGPFPGAQSFIVGSP